MANEKPQITATIKFRGVTIEGMTVQELRELRDVLNSIVGEKVVEKHIHHNYRYPWGSDRIYIGDSYPGTGTWAVSRNSLTAATDDSVLAVGKSDPILITCKKRVL